jgi:hypothetical protein
MSLNRKNIYWWILMLICLCPHNSDAAHDLRVARFRITATVSGYDFNVNFDREDILKEIYGQQKYEKKVINQITNYVEDHLRITIDDEPIAYELTEIEFTKDNILLRGKLLSALREIKKIDVQNTCLINQIDGHMNIMEFFLNDKERFFRLDKDRIRTTVKY